MLAFAWGAFWVGFIVGPVVCLIATFIIWSFTDEGKESRAVDRELDRQARAARAELFKERRQEVRDELRQRREQHADPGPGSGR